MLKLYQVTSKVDVTKTAMKQQHNIYKSQAIFWLLASWPGSDINFDLRIQQAG